MTRDEPESPLSLIEAAEDQLYSHDDPEACLALCDQALAVITDDEDFVEAVVLKASAEVALGDRDETARETLAELSACTIEDPALHCTLGDLWFELGDLDRARDSFRAAISADPEFADAYYGLGLIGEVAGDEQEMVTAWLRTRELDAQELPVPWHLSDPEFEATAEAALSELPAEIVERLANVPVMVDSLPEVDLVEQGCDPRVLGLFLGTPLTEKQDSVEQPVALDTILLFQHNLERVSEDRDQLAEEIRITVIHETAHFFGLEDDELDRLGLG